MKRNTLWTAIIVVLIIGLAAIPLTGFAQELAEPSAVDGGIDWYKLIVQVVVAVLGILLAVFANDSSVDRQDLQDQVTARRRGAYLDVGFGLDKKLQGQESGGTLGGDTGLTADYVLGVPESARSRGQ
jgi:hypothetical protein